MKIIFLTYLLLVISSCGESLSEPQTVFDESNMSFITNEQNSKSKIFKNVGILAYAEIDSEYPEDMIYVPFCSAVKISPKHIITNSHCKVDDKTIFFDSLLSKDEITVEFSDYFGETRIDYWGSYVSEPDASFSTKYLKGSVYKSPKYDFSVYELPDALHSNEYLDVREYVNAAGGDELSLIGHPNGAPKALSRNCNLISIVGGILKHDCDSLSGSSGSLLTSGDKLVGLHFSGSGKTDFNHYKLHGKFQNPDSLAQHNCKKISSEKNYNKCFENALFNKAILFEQISSEIENLIYPLDKKIGYKIQKQEKVKND